MDETLQIGLEKLEKAKEKVNLKQKSEKTELLDKLLRLSEQTKNILSYFQDDLQPRIFVYIGQAKVYFEKLQIN